MQFSASLQMYEEEEEGEEQEGVEDERKDKRKDNCDEESRGKRNEGISFCLSKREPCIAIFMKEKIILMSIRIFIDQQVK